MVGVGGVLLGGVALAVLSAVGGGLPDGYVELTCITSDGNQYLDTGYTPTSVDFGFELEFTFKGTVGTGGTRIIGSSTRIIAGLALRMRMLRRCWIRASSRITSCDRPWNVMDCRLIRIVRFMRRGSDLSSATSWRIRGSL